MIAFAIEGPWEDEVVDWGGNEDWVEDEVCSTVEKGVDDGFEER